MRNEENIGHIVGDKRAITSLSLTSKYILSVTSKFINIYVAFIKIQQQISFSI